MGLNGAASDPLNNNLIYLFESQANAKPDISILTADKIDATHFKLTFSENIYLAGTPGLAAGDITFVQNSAPGTILTSQAISSIALAVATNNFIVTLSDGQTFLPNDVYHVVYLNQTAASKITSEAGGYSPNTTNTPIAAEIIT
jgi:hypothetical protein